MYAALEEDGIGAVWPALRELRRHLATPQAQHADRVLLVPEHGSFRIETGGTARGAIAVPLRESPLPALVGLQPAVAAALQLYLPVLLGAFAAARAGRTFVTAHVAQSLDGRIACANGHSQWISNEANLRHAHRLRALHDAVLVGSRTVSTDDPQLTVRMVGGEQPRRVVLNGSASLLRAPRAWRVSAPPGALFVCADRARWGALPAGAEVMRLPADGDRIRAADLLAALHARGLRSVFVEGGARTLSEFAGSGRIDLLHVHVAPLLLGSGVPSFSLPVITAVQQAQRFDVEHFGLDGELLLACRPVRA